MKALQQIIRHESLEDAQEYMMVMSEQEGFLGGRVLLGYRTQLFFDCNQDMEYGILTDETNYSERIIKVINGQRLGVGIGNPHSHIELKNPTITIHSQIPPIQIETIEPTEKEVTTEEWLVLAEKTRLAWLSRKSDNHTEYKRCQAISHQAHDTWQRQLKLAVYE